MTASVEVARQAGAPGAVLSRGPGKPRPARRQRAAIPIVAGLAAQADRAAVATVTADSRDAFLSPSGARDLRILHLTVEPVPG